MAVGVLSVLLLLGLSAGTGTGTHPDSERGMLELQRVRSLAAQPRYGECWARALEHLDTRCRDMTSESQSRIALRFAHCHLSSFSQSGTLISMYEHRLPVRPRCPLIGWICPRLTWTGRDFPSCPEGSEVSRCTGGMDAVAFNTYTEFFTQTHSICRFLQSEAWQQRAENTMYRLTDTSAGVVQQLQSTRQIAEDLIEAQSFALQVQQEILTNGEELRTILRDSTQGLRSVLSDLSSVSQQQQVALSELFNRVSFLQSFLLMESHSLSSCCCNAAALCCAFLLTCTQRTCRARLPLFLLVFLNFYLETRICDFVMNQPEQQHLELLSIYLSVLRRLMLLVAASVLLGTFLRYKDPLQENLRLLQETRSSLQEALQHAERLCRQQEDRRLQESEAYRRVEERREEEEEESHLSHLSQPGSSVILSRTLRSSLVHSVPVEEPRPRYRLRSRKSESRS